MSADTILGTPANIINSSLLLRMVAQCTGYKAKEVIISFGDAHIYLDHLEGVKELINRDVIYDSPVLSLNNNITDIDDFTFEDFTFSDYQYQEKIYFPISV